MAMPEAIIYVSIALATDMASAEGNEIINTHIIIKFSKDKRYVTEGRKFLLNEWGVVFLIKNKQFTFCSIN